MPERTLIARTRPDEKQPETIIVASPVVGLAQALPRPGIYLNPLDRVLTLRVLGRRYVVRLPRDVHGRVAQVFIPDALTPVSFNEPILRLDPRGLAGAVEGARGTSSNASEEGSAEQDLIIVKAPSEGIFYRRPSPDAPPYVEVGARIASGAVLGLVEVMKCFNQIAYGGPGLPERGEIVNALAEDAAEVRFGQPLFWIKPVE